MRFIKTLFFVFLAVFSFAANPNPSAEEALRDYLNELDEMGRTLSGWHGDQEELSCWFFGSYAMFVLQNTGSDITQPYPSLEAIIPNLWKDFKYLSPRYLIELAGGALSYGDLMSVSEDRPFESLLTEEKFIVFLAGTSYFRMLEATVGSIRFDQIIKGSIQSINDPRLISDALAENISQHYGSKLGEQFKLAISTGSWMDVELKKLKKSNDSLDVYIEHKGDWAFPVEVLLITHAGDSISRIYGLEETEPLRVADLDYQEIILDPEHRLAEFYRYNNKWPRLKGNLYIQPFVSLPDWEYYRVIVSPSSWSDWDGDKRIGMKITSGFGLDLWPAYPSDYRHRVSLELNSHTPYDAANSWGARLSYGHPLSLKKRLFTELRMHNYDDWRGGSLGLTKYIGKQRFLVQGTALKYQRLNIEFEYDSFMDTLIWEDRQNVRVVKAAYSAFTLTNRGDGLYVKLRSALGRGPEGEFSILKSQIDLTGVIWKWLVGGAQFIAGTQEVSTPSPYRFTHSYSWQDNLAALPNFRGQPKISFQTSTYLGWSISGGYRLAWFQAKLFASSVLYDQAGIQLANARPHYAAGFGFEHKSFFTAGIYFPFWQSQPLDGKDEWHLRYQWQLTWNL